MWLEYELAFRLSMLMSFLFAEEKKREKLWIEETSTQKLFSSKREKKILHRSGKIFFDSLN